MAAKTIMVCVTTVTVDSQPSRAYKHHWETLGHSAARFYEFVAVGIIQNIVVENQNIATSQF